MFAWMFYVILAFVAGGAIVEYNYWALQWQHWRRGVPYPPHPTIAMLLSFTLCGTLWAYYLHITIGGVF